MASDRFMVFTNPNDGQEDEFNRWYDDQHIGDVLRVPGVVGAQRFRLADPGTGELAGFQYLAIYKVETDDPQSVLADLTSRLGTEQMVATDAMDPAKASMSLFEAISDRTAAARGGQ